ncbi:hypothetical protein Y032_0707g1698, partial [Ancylostoma ceylanicum]
APPSGVIAKIKKVLKKKTADDESELRKQPARVAKKPINYKEMNQNSAHVTKRNVTSSSSNAVTMILLSIALLGINTAAAQTIVCSNKGVLLNSTSPTKSEICVNYKECVTISADVNVSEITLPFKYLVNQHIVQWRTIINSKQETETIICPPGEICSKISCIFCAEFFGNPHCFPQLAVGIMAACLSLLMVPILMICYFVTSSTKRCYRLKQGKDNMTPRGSQGRQLERIFASHPLRSKMIVFTAIMTCLAAEAEACVFSHNINANNTICHKTNSSDNCRQVQETTITLSERRPEACLRLRNANQTVGSMEVRLQHVVLSCNPVVLFYTRDVDIITESAKRCHLAGSCTSQTCSHTRRTTQIPELQDTYDFPGVSRCTTSCGGIGCGCLLPMPGCLFSRTFARPRNTKVYRVFHCPTWEESAMIKITHSDAKGKRRTTIVNVISQTTKVLDNINVTLEFVTTPTIPLLSSIFLQAMNNDSNSEVALIGNDDVFALRCPTESSTSNITECVMEDTCSCSPTETDANCQCRNLNITERVSSVESRLPLSSSVLHLQDVHGRVQGITHDSVADLTIGTSVQYQTDNIVDYMDCDITASPLHGCYNCLSGAEVIFSCFSKQPIMVEVNCERHMFAAVCNSSTSHTAVTIHATVPKFKEACWVQCGPSLHNITLSGILAYHPSWIPSNNKQGNKHANYVDMFNYPNLEHILDVAMENWKTAVMTIVAVAVFIGDLLMAGEARSRVLAHGIRRTASNRSLASLPLSHASTSSVLKSEMVTNPYPLKGREVVLDLENRKQYEELRIDIKKLGGKIVEMINEDRLPFVVISDHPMAAWLESMKGAYRDKDERIKKLPMLLKDAVQNHVKVRSLKTFQEQFARFKSRISVAKSLSKAPQKRLPARNEENDKRVRLLRRPFIKWQDDQRRFAPSYKECPTPRWTTVYFGPAAGNCVFRRVTAEQLERRKQRENQAAISPENSDPPSSPGREREKERSGKSGKDCGKLNRTVRTPTNKFCDLCGKAFEDMEQHYESKEHATTATRPGVYDEVDMCIGAVVDYVIIIQGKPVKATQIYSSSARASMHSPWVISMMHPGPGR